MAGPVHVSYYTHDMEVRTSIGYTRITLHLHPRAGVSDRHRLTVKAHLSVGDAASGSACFASTGQSLSALTTSIAAPVLGKSE
jgi:hypothetical protein